MGSRNPAAKVAELSSREEEIARAYAAGNGYRAIADQLFIAPSTVRTHLSTIYRKLGVSSKIDLLNALNSAGSQLRPESALDAAMPSIAVLPFTNMSAEPEQDYFSDGITEDLITDLCKVPGLFVIARNSAFTFNGKSVDVVEIARQLGVRYVVEGSVRRAGNHLRITAQLIEATTAHHLWAERYERELSDVFTIQDEVAREIVTALQIRLAQKKTNNFTARGTDDLEAYDLLLRGRELYYLFTRDTNEQAASFFRRAIEIDPRYAEAHAQLGRTYLTSWNLGWIPGSEDSLEPAFEWSLRALAINPVLPQGHALLSHVYVWKREHDEAIAAADEAVALDPNNADAHSFRAAALCWSGRAREALLSIERAVALNPFYPGSYLFFYGMAYFELQQYADAIDVLRRAIIRTPDFLPNRLFIAAALAASGRDDEAGIEVVAAKRQNPALSVSYLCDFLPYKYPDDMERFSRAARRAGFAP